MSYHPGVLLYNRLALVTGGGSGIGRAVCQLFAKHGASVIIADVSKKGAEETADTLPNKVKNQAVQTDVSSADFNAQLLEFALATYERPPAIIVNCAGVTKDASLFKMAEPAWDWVLSVNLKGPFLTAQTFGRAMIDHKVPNGAIINISSIVGKTGNFGQANYGAAKAGLVGLTKCVARELGPKGIRVNAILPGLIETPMTKDLPDFATNAFQMLTPLGRPGKPEEVASAALYLASHELSSFVTGACLEVTGGFAM